jgi:hypothetical protein
MNKHREKQDWRRWNILCTFVTEQWHQIMQFKLQHLKTYFLVSIYNLFLFLFLITYVKIVQNQSMRPHTLVVFRFISGCKGTLCINIIVFHLQCAIICSPNKFSTGCKAHWDICEMRYIRTSHYYYYYYLSLMGQFHVQWKITNRSLY